MSRSYRPVLCLSAVSALMIAAFAGFVGLGGLSPIAPADVWSPGAAGEDFDEQHRLVIRRIEAKHRLTKALIGGKLTLLQTAGGFRDLDREPPPFSYRIFRGGFPGCSEEECYCRVVIDGVASALNFHPDREPVLARLEAEFRSHKVKGTLRLPTADDNTMRAVSVQ